MITGVTFRGGETTGGVSDRKIETAKQETTGSVGVRRNLNSIFEIDNEPKQDTVSFRAAQSEYNPKEKSSMGFWVKSLALLATFVGVLGLAYKHDWAGKVGGEKTQEVLRYTDTVTKHCYEACKWFKNNTYDRVAQLFTAKK